MEKGIFLKRKFVIITVSLVLLITPPLYYFYREYNKMYAQYQKTKLQLNKLSTSVQGVDTKAIIEKVNKLIELPKETPTVANITDKTKLKNNRFFANAQNGDVMLIFQNAKKAIIYREAINKIIEVGAVNINEEAKPSVTPIPTAIVPTKTVTPTIRISPAISPVGS